MLKSWSIENFKPIVNSGELKLAPVTVFAGLNSSGKSSLLQSILMISQTLSSRVLDRPLLPNGPIIQLGTFEDISSSFSQSHILRVGFEVDASLEDHGSVDEQGRLIDIWEGVKSVRIAASFNGSMSNGIYSSAIEASKVFIEQVELEIVVEKDRFNFAVRSVDEDELAQFLVNVVSEDRRLVPYGGNSPNYIGELKAPNEKKPEYYLVALAHFLPLRLIHKYRAKERYEEDLRDEIGHLLPLQEFKIREFNEAFFLSRLQDDYSMLNVTTAISESLKESINTLCRKEKIDELFSGKSLLELAEWFHSVRSGIPDDRAMMLADELQNMVAQDFLRAVSDNHDEIERLGPSYDFRIYQISRAGDLIASFFTTKIRYLGPLRADPQASQKFAPSSELDDVGARGEYAAAVYDSNQNARIRWYNPSSDQIEQNTLKVALDTWARYLGVAHQIKIETGGQSGFSWQVVHLKGQKALPLSAVGVGVSQILPILVMGLLAPQKTLLIIEQPELHLHPRVQGRLGDFFVGLSKCNKQCLIETHSENLVNQLRYHIVQAGGQDKSDCMIYFVNQDERGAARFEPVVISSKGNILNWPEGFFDETMQQEDRITAESIKRRANVARNG